MPVRSPLRCRLPWAVAACWMLLLTGCNPDSAVHQTNLEAELHAGDGVGQTLQRFFFPAAYWQEKSRLFQEQVNKQQEAFSERAKAYHLLLGKRREKVNQAISQAEAAGKAGDEARRLVIQEFRAQLDPVREETRQLGKALRHAMALLAQAEIAARQ